YAAVYRFDNLFFRRGGYLVMGDLLRITDTLLIDEFGRIDHYDATLIFEPRLDVVASLVDITANGFVNVSARGYLGGRHSQNSGFDDGRTVGNGVGSTFRSGGSYGGLGAIYDGAPNAVHGNSLDPAGLGSGGSDGSSNIAG